VSRIRLNDSGSHVVRSSLFEGQLDEGCAESCRRESPTVFRRRRQQQQQL